MPRNKKGRDLDKWRSTRPETAKGCVRVIGGEFKGKSLVYSGDKVTRPMKDSIREALLISLVVISIIPLQSIYSLEPASSVWKQSVEGQFMHC